VAKSCRQEKCRAYRLTVNEFERLGGERWTHSFRIRLGLLAQTLYFQIYGKKARKVRSSTVPRWRNKVGKYPCGILEQAYRKLSGEGETQGQIAMDNQENSQTRSDRAR
jgi:hypothetical protein